jgi:hypothetical protein
LRPHRNAIGECTYQLNPAAFWKIHDAMFDAQDVISPSNAGDAAASRLSYFHPLRQLVATCGFGIRIAIGLEYELRLV